MEFDPNLPHAATTHRWGSYNPDMHGKNRDKWKTHAKLQHVRAAIDNASRIIVYERVDGTWIERYRHEYRGHPPLRNPDVCRGCGAQIDRFTWAYWSPDEDFAKVTAHFSCSRKLKPRRG